MPEKDYTVILDNQSRIFVFFETRKGKIEKFVVKLESWINDHWFEIARYDTHHQCVHKDILSKNGFKKRTVFYKLLDKQSGIDVAINDFYDNYQNYVSRYLND